MSRLALALLLVGRQQRLQPVQHLQRRLVADGAGLPVAFFQLLAAVFLILLYRQWKRHGGNNNYVPPETASAPAFPVEVSKT